MITRCLAASLIAVGLAGVLASPASAVATGAQGRGPGILSVTAITQVYTYGQKVAAVAVEYRAVVNPRTLDTKTFTVSDSIYNFRYNPIEDLTKRADRTITRVYTNNSVAPLADASRPIGHPSGSLTVSVTIFFPWPSGAIPPPSCGVRMSPPA